MRETRKYIINSLLTQVIILPVILTFGLIVFGMSMEGLNRLGWGQDTAKFVRTLIGLTGSLLTGTVSGALFSWGYKPKPEKPLHRYLPVLAPVLYALIFALPALISAGQDFTSAWWNVYYFKNPMYLLLALVLALTGYSFLFPGYELMGYAGFALGMLLQERLAHTRVKAGEKSQPPSKIRQVLCNWPTAFTATIILALITSAAAAGNQLREGMIEIRYGETNIANDLTEYDLLKIAPFKADNGLARLERPAALQFTSLEEMPRLDGATAAYPVYAAFVEAVYSGLGDYYRVHADQERESKDVYGAFVESEEYPYNIVKCSKTDRAYQRLINQETDLIFVAEPSAAQRMAIQAQGDDFSLTPIASEAFVFFTNIQNPVDGLTAEQIRGIYSGGITNWHQVGGPFRSILAYQRPENSGSQTIMHNKVMAGQEMTEPNATTVVSGMGGVIKQVAEYKNAKNSLGYSFMYYSSQMIKNNQIKYLAVDGVKPTATTVRDKSYPYTVPVYAVTLKSKAGQENIQRFQQWILSAEGQELIEQTGYIPLQPDRSN